MRWWLLGLAGCSLGNVRSEPCSVPADCREAFGLGSTCLESGYCGALEAHPRCSATYPSDLLERPESYDDAIVLGTLFDLTTATENLQAIELAVDEANIEGGLDGRSFAIVSCDYAQSLDYDDLDGASAAIEVAGWMDRELGIQVVVGPGSSPRVEQIWPTTEPAGMLLVAPSATSDLLTGIDGPTSSDEDPGLFWRTAPPDVLQAAAIGFDISSRAPNEVAIIHQVGAYGQGLADGVSAALTMPVTTYPYDNSNALTAAIADAGNSEAGEVVFISSVPLDVSAFLNGAFATGDFVDKGLFLTDTARDAAVLTEAANAADLFPNVRGSNPVPDPDTAALEDTFYLAYSQRYGEDAGRDGFNTFSYDAAWVALYGLTWAHFQGSSLDGIEVARGLRQVSAPGGAPIPLRAASWGDLLTEFDAGRAVDVFGASGALDYDPTTGETSNPIAIWTLTPDGDAWEFTNQLLCDTTGACSPFPE